MHKFSIDLINLNSKRYKVMIKQKKTVIAIAFVHFNKEMLGKVT